ncbi:hypothetical protein SLA2020_201010 [Shorea laevis]
MATQSFTSSPIPTKPTLPTITNRPVHLPVIYSRTSSGRQKPFSSSVRATLSSAATTAVQPNEPTTYGKSSKTLPFRVGHGFDLHRLEPGYPLIIGLIFLMIEAVRLTLMVIPHFPFDTFVLIFNSFFMGCVLLHCVVDAILGALGLPDIGQIFPDSDPKCKGAPSSVFIKEAVRLMHEAGYEIGNLDATLILQRPKLSPHKEAIRANLSELLGADPSIVNLKAKTHEKVDSLGENRSIAAHTVIVLMRK